MLNHISLAESGSSSSLSWASHLTQMLVTAALLLTLTSCVTPPPAPEPPKPIEPVLSAEPIDKPSAINIHFAQTALNQLGYKAGLVDGIWGPRSANAMRAFETAINIQSANGRLSELNLTRLSEITNTTPEQIQLKSDSQSKKPKEITALLDRKVPLSKAAQLIIVEKSYEVLAKPNPYSAVINRLNAGNAVYILGLKNNWYLVESLNRQRGYIQKK